MKDEIDGISDSRRGTPGWMFAAVAVLGVVALVGLVLAHNASTQAQEIQQALENKVKALQTDFTNQIATIQQHETQTDAANSGLQSDLSVMTKKLRLTQGDLKKAHAEAAEIKTESEQKIAEMDGAVKTELATKASRDDVKTVDGRVSDMGALAWIRKRRSRLWRPCRFRCLAGKQTMSAALKMPRAQRAPGFRRRGTIRGRPARRTSCERILNRPCG